ncbi:unnamed protein product [Cuscuta campestris]|uniref:Retrotransposon gag domain-containing protein n=1 Tax=Cuscuta campestris TaxID=132261 RepID=A0A484LMJ8_9ASTE|nr:unnamed protein product [Cuscuta campestris]
MSQAPEHGQVGPQGEQEHVSVHIEASSFTPQHEVLEPQVPQPNAVPQAVPYLQPQIAANMLQFLQQMAGAYVPPPSPPVVVVTIEKLKKNGAEEFCGDQIAEPMAAKRWLERDAAYDWWKCAGANIPEPVPWATFDELFREEYVPEHFMEEKRDEFMKFTQGELTLLEYRQKFDELAEFGRDLVPTVEKRRWSYRRPYSGRLSMSSPRRRILDRHRHPDPARAARGLLTYRATRTRARRLGPHQPCRQHPLRKVGRARVRADIGTRSATFAAGGTLASAGSLRAYALGVDRPGITAGTARRTLARCSRQCPQLQPQLQPPSPHRVISSTLSYLCTSMPVSSNIPRENLENPVIVSNPLGHSLCLKYIYPDCPLVVQGKSFPANLIELPHREFDVILGMDWLTANQAVVDCGAHTVQLKAEDGNDVLIRGELFLKAPEFISYMQARRLIRKKCEAFLCTVRDTQLETPGREEIPTVCEFPDVFPDELPGLPPPREVEFSTTWFRSSDNFYRQTCELASRGEKPDFSVREDGVLLYRARVVVPVGEVGKRTMEPDPDDWVIGAADERQCGPDELLI